MRKDKSNEKAQKVKKSSKAEDPTIVSYENIVEEKINNKINEMKGEKPVVDDEKKNHRQITKFVIVLTILIAALYLLFVIGSNFDNSQFLTAFYQHQSDNVDNNIRIVQLSDLHIKEFGKNNEKLVAKVKALKPDIIAMTGDMNDDNNDDYSVVVTLCKQLVEDVAPVYYCYGNNESTVLHFNKESNLRKDLADVGVVTLGDTYDEITIGSTDIAICGVAGSKDSFYGDRILKEFCEKESDKFRLLLCHRPELYVDRISEEYDVDLALCGHTHGGQWILPYFGGVYASDQGLFPQYDYGQFEIGNSEMIISKGLGSSSIIPRFNNPPEITVTDINWY